MTQEMPQKFGRYVVQEELGRGAMGVVYKAQDPTIGRVVAIKVLSPIAYLQGDAAFRERFLREAQAAGRLTHPGIVTIFDVGEQDETKTPYIVMECVSGQTLDRILVANGGKLPVYEALRLIAEVAVALDYAHEQGVVHRDLKPENILITEDGHAKITDFGVARLNISQLTMHGEVFGTPAYMAPEQLRGEEVDGRADLFSLGVILYTCITGFRPFQGSSHLTMCFKLMNQDPVPAGALNSEVSTEVESILSRALEKNANRRYQRASEMAFDIQDVQEGKLPRSLKTNPEPAVAVDMSTATPTLIAKAITVPEPIPPAAMVAAPPTPTASPMVLRDPRKSVVLLALLFVLGGSVLYQRRVSAKASRQEASAISSQPAAPKPTQTLPQVPLNTSAATSQPAVKAAKETRETRKVKKQPTIAKAEDPRGNLPEAHNSKKTVVLAEVSQPFVVTPSAKPVEASSPEMSKLDLEIDHHFKSAVLYVTIDGSPAGQFQLEGDKARHLLVLKRVRGESEHEVDVPVGSHRVSVRVHCAETAYDHSQELVHTFSQGTDSKLLVSFDKHDNMSLSFQ